MKMEKVHHCSFPKGIENGVALTIVYLFFHAQFECKSEEVKMLTGDSEDFSKFTHDLMFWQILLMSPDRH